MSLTPAPPLYVLVVEDETLMRWALVEMLTRDGHEVIAVEDARSAREAVGSAESPFDVVLLDVRLSDCDDLSLLGDIRRLSPQSAVILMSVDTRPEIVDDARALGVAWILTKPFDLAEVKDIVATASARGRSH